MELIEKVKIIAEYQGKLESSYIDVNIYDVFGIVIFNEHEINTLYKEVRDNKINDILK